MFDSICWFLYSLYVSCLGETTAFRALVNLYNSTVHTKKSVYVTLKSFRWDDQWSQFHRVGQVITLHHWEMMRLITLYNAHIKHTAAALASEPTECTLEEEDRPLAQMKAGASKRPKKVGHFLAAAKESTKTAPTEGKEQQDAETSRQETTVTEVVIEDTDDEN